MGLISNRGTDPDTRQQARKNSVNQPEGVGQIHGPLLGGTGDSRKSLCSGGAEWECTANSSCRLSANSLYQTRAPRQMGQTSGSLGQGS